VSDAANMTELDALTWIKARRVWQFGRAGRQYTLALWVGDAYTAKRVDFEVTTDSDSDNGIPLIALVRLARHELETTR